MLPKSDLLSSVSPQSQVPQQHSESFTQPEQCTEQLPLQQSKHVPQSTLLSQQQIDIHHESSSNKTSAAATSPSSSSSSSFQSTQQQQQQQQTDFPPVSYSFKAASLTLCHRISKAPTKTIPLTSPTSITVTSSAISFSSSKRPSPFSAALRPASKVSPLTSALPKAGAPASVYFILTNPTGPLIKFSVYCNPECPPDDIKDLHMALGIAIAVTAPLNIAPPLPAPTPDTTPGLSRLMAATDRVLSGAEAPLWTHFTKQVAAVEAAVTFPHQPVRVWSLDKDDTSRRGFILASIPHFYQRYSTLTKRHFYEIIRSNHPVRLYFDLEYSMEQGANSTLSPSDIISTLQTIVFHALHNIYSLPLQGPDSVIELDSTTDSKWSKHLIIHLQADKAAFASSVQAGFFIGNLIDHITAGRMGNPKPFYPSDINWSCLYTESGSLVIDTGVYTNNRSFRLMGSSKHSKTAVLTPTQHTLETFSFPYPPNHVAQDSPSSKEHLIWLASLVEWHAAWPWVEKSLAAASSPSRILTSTPPVGPHPTLAAPPAWMMCLPQQYGSINPDGPATQEPLPMSLSGSTMSHIPRSEYASLHAWAASTWDNVAASVGASTGRASYVASAMGTESKAVVSLTLGGNRYCARVKRQHKSNAVYLVLNLRSASLVQKCHDPDCQGFRSDPIVIPYILLPPELAPKPPTLNLVDDPMLLDDDLLAQIDC